MYISNDLGPYNFCRKMEKTLPMRKEMDGKVFICRQSGHFSFVKKMIKVLFLLCTLTLRVNNPGSRQGEGINRRIESTKIR